ncbi:MAG: GNAT family N-acetyltransferase [Desulfobacteraceae bacterium]|nr:GNAT family N-acetyltransferase [Desulfobacteraceae bacterium]
MNRNSDPKNSEHPHKKMSQASIETQKGAVYIQSARNPGVFKGLSFPFETCHSAAYRLTHCTKKSLQGIIEKGGRVALALLEHKIIVGFAVLDFPDKNERWILSDPKIAMELKAVEVLREFRNHGIARQLLACLFSEDFVEEKIIYLTAYSWTWDLAYPGFTVLSYRDMLLSLYWPAGFLEFQTNEPNICLKPENLFMVRTGKKISREIQDEFKLLRFGLLS